MEPCGRILMWIMSTLNYTHGSIHLWEVLLLHLLSDDYYAKLVYPAGCAELDGLKIADIAVQEKTIEVDETLGNFTAVKGSHLPRISNSVQSICP